MTQFAISTPVLTKQPLTTFFFLFLMKHSQPLRILEQTFSIFGMGKSTNVKSVAVVVTRLLTLAASTYVNPTIAFRFATSPYTPAHGSLLQSEVNFLH